MEEKKFKLHYSGLKVAEDGEILVPKSGIVPEHYTYGCSTIYGHKQVHFNHTIFYIHRLVAETYLNNNQPIQTGYIVHHININPSDNRVENLVILSHNDHVVLHNKGKIVNEETRKKLSKANIGKHLTEETKRKLSELLSGEKHPMFGKHHTEETKHKMSEVKKGNQYGAKPVEGINKKTGEHLIFKSAKEAGSTLNINPTGITKCCKGKIKTCGGYVWSYV